MKRTHPTVNIQVAKDRRNLLTGAVPLTEQQVVTNAEGESLDYREGKALLKPKNSATQHKPDQR